MQAVILNSESKADLKLLLDLAKKIGINSRILKASEIEEIGLINAISSGRTNEYLDNVTFLNKLRK
jgi:hypothetical protein